MEYQSWEPIYRKITKELNISIYEDAKAALILDELINELETKLNINFLKNLIKNKKVAIFGAGPSLEANFEEKMKFYDEFLKITADGATSLLFKNGIIPDIIVTDLDGKISDQIASNKKGSIVIIHAHANNINKIKNYFSLFTENVIGTTQTNPSKFSNLYNLGGFTDGDRAVCIADHLKADKIYLTGFDFNGKIGKYSYPKHKTKNLKLRKLEWCKYIINYLKNENIMFI